jgi:hypothetical protein
MFKDRMFIRQLSELPSSLETTLLYNRSLKISGDISLLERIKSEKNRESRVTQEMIKRPKVVWEKDNVIYRNNKVYCYDPQPYAHLASICQSIRLCVSPIPALFEPATFVYLFS